MCSLFEWSFNSILLFLIRAPFWAPQKNLRPLLHTHTHTHTPCPSCWMAYILPFSWVWWSCVLGDPRQSRVCRINVLWEADLLIQPAVCFFSGSFASGSQAQRWVPQRTVWKPQAFLLVPNGPRVYELVPAVDVDIWWNERYRENYNNPDFIPLGF